MSSEDRLEHCFASASLWSFRPVTGDVKTALIANGAWPKEPLALAFSCGRGWFCYRPTRWSTRVFRDNRLSLILYHPKMLWYPRLLGIIGFNTFGNQSLIVTQIQGVRHAHRELAGTRWDRLLLSAVIVLGRYFLFEDVRVQKSHFNEYLCPEFFGGQEPRERERAFRLRYDVLSKRMGFKDDPGDTAHRVLDLRTQMTPK